MFWSGKKILIIGIFTLMLLFQTSFVSSETAKENSGIDFDNMELKTNGNKVVYDMRIQTREFGY